MVLLIELVDVAPYASIAPLLNGKPLARKEPLYWHFNRAAGDFHVAMRVGDLKILARLDKTPPRGNDVVAAEETDFKAAEPVEFAFYNLRDDPAEMKDLAAAMPDRFGEMKTRLIAKYHEVRNESPTWPEWKFDNREGARIEWPDYVKNRQAKKKAKAK